MPYGSIKRREGHRPQKMPWRHKLRPRRPEPAGTPLCSTNGATPAVDIGLLTLSRMPKEPEFLMLTVSRGLMSLHSAWAASRFFQNPSVMRAKFSSSFLPCKKGAS